MATGAPTVTPSNTATTSNIPFTVETTDSTNYAVLKSTSYILSGATTGSVNLTRAARFNGDGTRVTFSKCWSSYN